MTIRDAKGSRAAKSKGRAFENEVLDVFKGAGFPNVERRRQMGVKDHGDLSGVDCLMIECKSVRTITLAAFMAEVIAQTDFAVDELGIAVVKRVGKGAEHAYAVLPLGWFAEHWREHIDLLELSNES